MADSRPREIWIGDLAASIDHPGRVRTRRARTALRSSYEVSTSDLPSSSSTSKNTSWRCSSLRMPSGDGCTSSASSCVSASVDLCFENCQPRANETCSQYALLTPARSPSRSVVTRTLNNLPEFLDLSGLFVEGHHLGLQDDGARDCRGRPCSGQGSVQKRGRLFDLQRHRETKRGVDRAMKKKTTSVGLIL